MLAAYIMITRENIVGFFRSLVEPESSLVERPSEFMRVCRRR